VSLTSNHGNGSVKVFDNILVVTPKEAKDYGKYMGQVSNIVDTTRYEIELRPYDLVTNPSGKPMT